MSQTVVLEVATAGAGARASAGLELEPELEPELESELEPAKGADTAAVTLRWFFIEICPPMLTLYLPSFIANTKFIKK